MTRPIKPRGKLRKLIERHLDPVELLMQRPHANVKLWPEEAECLQIADMMRGLTLKGRYRGVWFHVPNGGRRGKVTTAVYRMLGLIPGVADYAFLWDGGCGVIEVKAGRGRLEDSQKHFRVWCERTGVPWALCYSADELNEQLRAWGALTD